MATTTLALDLTINRPNPITATTLTQGAYASTSRSGTVRTFQGVPVDPGVTLLLRVEMPTVAAGAGGAASDLLVQQELTVGGDLALTPTRSGFAELRDWHPLHPRIRIVSARPPYQLAIDLLFVDVSAAMFRLK